MARGTSDFGNINASFSVNQVDNAETQQMLTGIGLLDGLGKTVYFDNFSKGLGGFAKLVTGAASSPAIADVNDNNIGGIYAPPYSAKLNPGVILNDASSLLFRSILGVQQNIGVEFGFCFTSATSDFQMSCEYYRLGGSAKAMSIRGSIKNNTLELLVGAAWTSLGNFNTFLTGNTLRIAIKIVADFVTQKYKKLLIGEKSIDINAFTLGNSGLGQPGGSYLHLDAVSYGAGTTSLYLGYFRLSKDEP